MGPTVRLGLILVISFPGLAATALESARQREHLDRGLVVRAVEGGGAYLSWRLLLDDAPGVTFNVYRRDSAALMKLNAEPLRKTCDWLDTSAGEAKSVWFVCPVVERKEGPPSRAAGLEGDASRPAPYRSIKLDGDHAFQKVGLGDLDGDGRYDFVIKQPDDNIDPWFKYWKRSPGTYQLEAYAADGRFLWRFDLGWAIERGVWYSPYLVYDLDGDGRAEVAVKTGEGDPRDAEGKVTSGREYLTILDGRTGKPIAQADWPSREGFLEPHSYNHMSRNQLCVAYLDGKRPSIVAVRGTYGLMKVVAWQLRDRKLVELWRWDNANAPRDFWAQGAHTTIAADLDGDGRDEIVLGSAVLRHDGRPLWSTNLGHPDHVYVGRIDPTRPGLQIYYGIEPELERNGMCLVDAKTGRILWGHDRPTWHVHSAGLCADLDPEHPGCECYGVDHAATDQPFLYSARGQRLPLNDLRGLAPRAVYWDADPQRELLIDGKLSKYRSDANGHGRVPSMWPTIEGKFIAVADVWGDWREEIITSLPGELRIYTTRIPATERRVCLMQDPLYRANVASAAMGYYQVPTTSYDVATESRDR